MQQAGYMFIFLVIIVNLFGIFLDFLNLRNINTNSLEKVKDIYPVEKPISTIKYQKFKMAIQIVKGVIEILVFFYLFSINIIQTISLDIYKVQTFEFIKAFLLFVSFYAIFKVIEIPFAIFDTFYIEKIFEFNKTTKKLFIKDMILQLAIGLFILFVILFAIVSFINIAGFFLVDLGILLYYIAKSIYPLYLSYIYCTAV